MREAEREDSLRSVRLERQRERALARLLSAVRLDTDETACLVSERSSRECLFTVPDFNLDAERFLSLEFPGEAPAPSEETVKGIRGRILEARLEGAFRGYSEKAFRERAEADAEASAENRAPSGGFALPPGIDSALVARIYREEWVSLARAQERAWFEIYASTDSGLIDSLGGVAAKPGPWAPAHYPARDVPEEWLRYWPGLTPMRWSPSLKTAFGYARVKVNRKPPTLAESLPMLIQYASLRMDSPAPERSSSVVRKAAFQVSARLVPRAKRVPGQRFREDSLLGDAALRYPMRRMSSLDLPASAQAGIQGPNPFPADYGYWWIDSAGARPVFVDVPDASVRGERDSLMAVSKRILASKQRDRISARAESAWRRDLEGKGLREEALRAEWIAANLVIREDFRMRE